MKNMGSESQELTWKEINRKKGKSKLSKKAKALLTLTAATLAGTGGAAVASKALIHEPTPIVKTGENASTLIQPVPYKNLPGHEKSQNQEQEYKGIAQEIYPGMYEIKKGVHFRVNGPFIDDEEGGNEVTWDQIRSIGGVNIQDAESFLVTNAAIVTNGENPDTREKDTGRWIEFPFADISFGPDKKHLYVSISDQTKDFVVIPPESPMAENIPISKMSPERINRITTIPKPKNLNP